MTVVPPVKTLPQENLSAESLATHFLSAPGYAGSSEETIAYKKSYIAGGVVSPTIIWCGGLKSDMEGGKALHLHDWALRTGRGFVRFDYFGHGESSGRFRDGTVSRWGRDVVQVMDELTSSDVILVGSSMGGWASLLAMLERPERVKAMLLIAPAPDFTEKLMWANWPEEVRRAVTEDGIHYEPSDYDEPYEYSRDLIEDGRAHQILDAPIEFDGPVHILQGAQDAVVPWEHSRRLVDVLTARDVTFTLVKSGDHSLSRPEDLDRLERAIEALCTKVTGVGGVAC